MISHRRVDNRVDINPTTPISPYTYMSCDALARRVYEETKRTVKKFAAAKFMVCGGEFTKLCVKRRHGCGEGVFRREERREKIWGRGELAKTRL